MSNLLTAEIRNVLSHKCTSFKLIITIGNDLRADDGVGPYIARNCKSLKVGLKLLDAGDKPENIIDKAVELKPSEVIIIDAADFGGKTGEARLIDSENIPDGTLSTHTFPLKIIAKMLEYDCGAPVYFLGIQPKSVQLGEGLSAEVKATADNILLCLSRPASPCGVNSSGKPGTRLPI